MIVFGYFSGISFLAIALSLGILPLLGPRAAVAGLSSSGTNNASNVMTTTISSSTTWAEVTVPEHSLTSSSLPFEVYYYFRLGLYSTTPISRLRLGLGWGYWADSFSCTAITVGHAEALRTTGNEVEWAFDFGPEGLRQSQRILACGLAVWHAEAGWHPQVTILDALDVNGEFVDVSTSLCMDCGRSDPEKNWGAPPRSDYDTCGRNICGDVVPDAVYSVSDAVRVLLASVGIDSPKYSQQYDTDRDGRIGTDDALRVLRRSVGLSGDLICPKPPDAKCGFVPNLGDPYIVTFRLDSSDAAIGALGIVVDYKDNAGVFEGSGDDVSCYGVTPGTLFAANDLDASKELTFALITIAPFSAPTDLVVCTFDGTHLDAPQPSDFHIRVIDAANEEGEQVGVAVSVSVVSGFD